jgi:Kef-type K+ transport system membrane component KefB
MNTFDVPRLLGLLVVILAIAKLLGALAQRIGQPAVMGELVAGVILGMSVTGLVDTHNDYLHLFAEIGVVLLLFQIGLETDLAKLMQVGGTATVVAVVGVVLPFILGYAVCWMLGHGGLVAVVAGASLTATSIGITARVLADLGRLHEPESQVILGAAVLDDVVGLIVLAVVAGLMKGQQVTLLSVTRTTALAFGFLVITLLMGRLIVPPLVTLISRLKVPGTPTLLGIMAAFGLAWLASVSGSALIIGAFAAGLLLRATPLAYEIERGTHAVGHLFVPLFFVIVGAAVDVRVLNPVDPANRTPLALGGLLFVAAVVGKLLAGYAPFWYRGNKTVIGVGMIPRGEVGLIFAQRGLVGGVFDVGLFSAVMVMVMATTFMTPPLLKLLFPPLLPSTRCELGDNLN